MPIVRSGKVGDKLVTSHGSRFYNSAEMEATPGALDLTSASAMKPLFQSPKQISVTVPWLVTIGPVVGRWDVGPDLEQIVSHR